MYIVLSDDIKNSFKWFLYIYFYNIGTKNFWLPVFDFYLPFINTRNVIVRRKHSGHSRRYIFSYLYHGSSPSSTAIFNSWRRQNLNQEFYVFREIKQDNLPRWGPYFEKYPLNSIRMWSLIVIASITRRLGLHQFGGMGLVIVIQCISLRL